MKLKQIDNNGTLQGYVLVKSCDRKNAKNGSVYLDMVISDVEGDVITKMWDFKGNLSEQPVVNTVVLVRGVMNSFNGQPQFRLDRFRPVNDSDDINISDLVPSSTLPGEQMYNEITALVDSFDNDELKKLTLAVLEQYKERICELPAAFRLHHAIRGGLLMHTLSICRLAECVAKLYPSVDRSLLLAGAILHDIAKSEEFNLAPTGLVEGYTAKGMLIGHLVRGAMIIEETGKSLSVSEDTMMLLEHMLISHHGKPEFGAAVRPLFLEAEILSALDTLDADIYEIENVLKEIPEGEFSNRVWALDDRKFYNHGKKTIKTEANL